MLVSCTDMTRHDVPDSLAAAEQECVLERRDLAIEVIREHVRAGGSVTGLFLVAINRASYS